MIELRSRSARVAALAVTGLQVGLLALDVACDTTAYVGDPLEIDPCLDADAAWVLCSSFERATAVVWDDEDGNPEQTNTRMVDPGPLQLEGNHVMRLHLVPGKGGLADLVKQLPGTSASYYARWYMRWQPGTPLQSGSGELFAGQRWTLGIEGVVPAPDDFYSVRLVPEQGDQLKLSARYAGMYMQCPKGAKQCEADSFPCMLDEGETHCTRREHREQVLPPVMTVERWYCLEFMVNGGNPTAGSNGADAEIAYWVDGQAAGPWGGLWMRSVSHLRPGVFWLALMSSTSLPAEAGLLIDDLVVSTKPIGCRR